MDHEEQILESIERLEQRIAVIEEHLGITTPPPLHEAVSTDTAPDHDAAHRAEEREEELEYELGQSWFAKVGIVALALGIAFLLTLPLPDVPQVAVSLVGYVLGAGLFILSRLWKETLTLLSNYMRGAAIALLYFSTLRLTYFSADPALPYDSPLSFLPLIGSAALAFYLALRRESVHLTLLATVLAYISLFVCHSLIILAAGSVLLAGVGAYLYVQRSWTRVYLTSMALAPLAMIHWAVGEPFITGALTMRSGPSPVLLLPLATAVIFAVGTLRRRVREEGYDIAIAAVLNGGGAYAALLLLTLGAFTDNFVLWHVLSSLTLLGLAVAFWVSEKSKYSTFLYAMLGYQAMTVALLKAFEVPQVFIWLSIQSLVVVATAVWFRSRFIVVVNFFIYVVIFLGYLVVAEQASGFSFAFGLVALVSARILNWKQENLELKTDAMRNAYLVSAFVVIPYSLYHAVSTDLVPLSWVGVALAYYVLSAFLKLQKYRWMGHATLMLSAAYVLVIGIVQLDTMYRVISFLVLGVVLLGTSIFFTRRRTSKRSSQEEGDAEKTGI